MGTHEACGHDPVEEVPTTCDESVLTTCGESAREKVSKEEPATFVQSAPEKVPEEVPAACGHSAPEKVLQVVSRHNPVKIPDEVGDEQVFDEAGDKTHALQ